jgi:hypothetical protein
MGSLEISNSVRKMVIFGSAFYLAAVGLISGLVK